MGPPGSGKGTQSTALAEQLGATPVTTSTIITQMLAEVPPAHAARLKHDLEKGILAPPALFAAALVRVIANALSSARLVVVDGSPRTLREAEVLVVALDAERVRWMTVILDVPRPVSVDRILHRWICEKCRQSVSTPTPPPACSRCGGRMIRRPDDTEDVIGRRWEQYEFRTAPVIRWLQERAPSAAVDGTRPIPEVSEKVARAVQEFLASESSRW